MGGNGLRCPWDQEMNGLNGGPLFSMLESCSLLMLTVGVVKMFGRAVFLLNTLPPKPAINKCGVYKS